MAIITAHIVPLRKLCPSLPGTMKGILMSLPGVTDAEVEYETRSLTVTYDDALLSEATLLSEIGKETGIAMTVEHP